MATCNSWPRRQRTTLTRGRCRPVGDRDLATLRRAKHGLQVGFRRKRPHRVPQDRRFDGWPRVLLDLANKGRIDRGRLIDETLAALSARSRPETTLGFRRYLDYLELTVDETAAREGAFRDLLRHGQGPIVGEVIEALKQLHDAGRLDVAAFLTALPAALGVLDKGRLKSTLSLVERIARQAPAELPLAALAIVPGRRDHLRGHRQRRRGDDRPDGGRQPRQDAGEAGGLMPGPPSPRRTPLMRRLVLLGASGVFSQRLAASGISRWPELELVLATQRRGPLDSLCWVPQAAGATAQLPGVRPGQPHAPRQDGRAAAFRL